MRILHILSTPRAEGTPNLVLDWLSAKEYEQDVFVLNSQPADLTDQLRSGANWYGEANHFSQGWRKFFGIAQSVGRVCKERHPDLVVSWPTGFSNWVCLGARLAGCSRVLVHCGNPPSRGRTADWMTRYVMWPVAMLRGRCICCSDYVREEFRRVPWLADQLFSTVWNCARVKTIRERAAEARQKRARTEEIRAIMVATLENHKDHETLLRALPMVHQALPQLRIWIAGDGTLRRQLEFLAAELKVDKIVDFLGTRRDIPELLGQSDLFVFSTKAQEGLGSVMVEALAASLPVVASDVPACREVLANGRWGMLVRPRDSVALATGIIRTLTAPSAIDQAAIDAYLCEFSVNRMMTRYVEIGGLGNQVA